ncbi:immunoglobulin-like domain-containing protein [Pseudomonadota bacterium]
MMFNKKKLNAAIPAKYLAASLLSLSSLSASATTAGDITSGTFTMYDGTGGYVGGASDVVGSFGSGTWGVSSSTVFFGQNWTAHSGTTFGPGTYSFATVQGGTYTGVTVGAGQVGGHILFNWGVVADIDVVNVWDVATTPVTVDAAFIGFQYTSTDVIALNPAGPDGILGLGMLDGAFVGFNANFDFIVAVADTTPPVITLNGSDPQIIVQDDPYVPLTANCVDVAPQDIYPLTASASGTVNTAVIADYIITYNCDDAGLNAADPVTRTVTVVPPQAVTTLLGTTPFDYQCETDGGTTYTDAGAQCADPEDGTWTSAEMDPAGTSLVMTGTLPLEDTPGDSTTLTWTCTDSDSNTGIANRVVNVVDTLAPVPSVFTLNDTVSALETPTGPLYFESNDVAGYVADPTMEAVADACDTTVSADASVSGTVVTTIPDGDARQLSTLTYTSTDATGNIMSVDLEVQVRRSEPMITLLGDSKIFLDVDAAYVELGMDIHDEQDGDIDGVTESGNGSGSGGGGGGGAGGAITYTIDSSAVDMNTQGTYLVFYDVTDQDGNAAAQAVRTVVVGASYGNFTMLNLNGDAIGGTNDVVMNWLNQTLNTSEADTNVNMTIATDGPTPFQSNVWYAHHVRVFEGGIGGITYTFDTTCTVAQVEAGESADCTGNPLPELQTERYLSMTVGQGQFGAHMLFDWGVNSNIDVVIVWDQNAAWTDPTGQGDALNDLWLDCCGAAPAVDTEWELVSTDVNGDGINGAPMVDGAFVGFYANFNNGPASTGAGSDPLTADITKTSDLEDDFLGSIGWGLMLGIMSLLGVLRIRNRRISK